MNLWRNSSAHPGWPMPVGPLRVPAGVVGLRPVRLRDGAQWDVRHAISQWPSVSSGLRSEARKGRMLPYVIEVDGEFSGQLTIGNVTHGALKSAWIGYWVASTHTGGGVATAALALGMDHAFGPVRLHRLEATVRPENAASRAVLAKVGFREEGLLKRYLEVDGAWRDHLLVGITVEEMHGSVSSLLVREGHASWT